MTTILLRTVTVYFFISVVFRMMGKRQIGDLELSDLVATLFLSELAALSITDRNIPLLYSLIPILIILCLEILITFAKNKVPLFKRLMESRPSILICRGILDQKELGKMRISIEELISECRLQGYSNLSDVYYAILEQDGKLSVIPRAEKSPICPEDCKSEPKERGIAYPIITDGEVNDEHLSMFGYDRAWLEKTCKKHGCCPCDIFLMTVNDANEIHMIKKESKKA